MLYYFAVVLRRTLGSLRKLNEFSRTELAKEPMGDVVSSDSIFAGAFTLLSNLLTVPGVSCIGFSNMKSIVSALILARYRVVHIYHALF